MSHLVDVMLCAHTDSGAMLLTRPRESHDGLEWSFPSRELRAADTPLTVAQSLARRSLGRAVEMHLTDAETVPAARGREARLALVYLARVDKPSTGTPPVDQIHVWWELAELGYVRIGAPVRRVLMHHWNTFRQAPGA